MHGSQVYSLDCPDLIPLHAGLDLTELDTNTTMFALFKLCYFQYM